MCKSIVIGLVTVLAGLVISATYFFPHLKKINSFFTNNEKVDSTWSESNQISSENEETTQTITNTRNDSNSNIENPFVELDKDTVEKLLNSENESKAVKTKILEGEIPHSKSY